MFLVLEGLDSSGKKTQIDLLVDKIKTLGKPFERIDFPMYDTTMGKMVASYLRGELGKKEELSPESAAMLYMLDRYQFRDRLQKMLDDGKIVIANRYTQSNLAFQGAKLSGTERWHFIKWMEDSESRLPQPTLVVYLDMPPEAAMQLAHGDRDYLPGKKYDIHEEDIAYQNEVRKVYLELAKRKGWLVVRCAEQTGKAWRIRPPQEIHEDLWKRVSTIIEWSDS
ncbi:dTMP kinase [Candidatus Micrarchaeota archaeon]|nr:dTMP kinase [Candidatus Micrarchaeota archaeon]